MEILRFHASESGTRSIPDRKTEITDLNAAGKAITKSDVHSWKTVRDPSAFSKIVIFSEDAEAYGPALTWRIGEEIELCFPVVPPGRKEQMEVEILGHFEVPPSAHEIHGICEDHLLLASRFPVYADVFNKPLSPAIIEEILNHLLDEGGNLLPPWISRVLELRKANKGGTK